MLEADLATAYKFGDARFSDCTSCFPVSFFFALKVSPRTVVEMANFDDKKDVSTIEYVSDSSERVEKAVPEEHGGLDETNLPDYHDKEVTRILRKVDYRLVPMLTLLYLLAFLDRGNIGNAKVAGMNEDLNLTGTEYNLALTGE